MDAMRTYWRRRRWWGWQQREMTQAELVAYLESIGFMQKMRERQ